MPDILISQFDRKFALPIETWRTVNNLTTRDSIPTNVRWAGMIVYVQSESLSYILQGGVDNSDWVELGSLVNVTVVDDLLSTSPTDALSANQGRILKDLIDNIDPTVEWGDIGGTLADQTDLQSALDGKLNDTTDTFTGTLTVDGIINLSASTTETRGINVGNGRSGSGLSYVDLVGDSTYTDYGLRAVRNGGANSSSQLIHRGTGNFELTANESAPIIFRTSNASRLTVASDGNINVNSTSVGLNFPNQAYLNKIDMFGNGNFTLGAGTGYTFGGLSSSTVHTSQMNNSDGNGWWWGRANHTTAQGSMALRGDGRMTIASYTRLGYGQSDSTVPGTTYMLQVNGSIQASNFVLSSDISLKTSVETISETFRSFRMIGSDEKRYGVIAQEIELIWPELVTVGEDGLKSVNYIDLLCLKVAQLEERLKHFEDGRP